MPDGDLSLWPLWPALTRDMLLRPALPTSPSTPYYISVGQLADFVNAGGIAFPIAIAQGGTGAVDAVAARANLGAAPLDSPVFTGTPQAPTQLAGDNSQRLATTAFVQASFGSPNWDTIINKPATYPPTLPIPQSGVTNLVADLAAKAPLASPLFTGDPRAPTPAPGDSDTSIATTAFVKAQGYGTGTITGVTAGAGLSGGGTSGAVTLSLVTPVALNVGGTGATSGAQGLDNLSGVSGTNAGVLTRSSGGAWSLTAAGGTGTVTSLTAGTGIALTPTTITTTGSVALANMAANTLKGNNTGASSAPADLSVAQAQALLAVPAPSSTTPATVGTAAVGTGTTYARADHVHGAQTVTLSGDISGSGTTAITTTLATVPIAKGGTGQTSATSGFNALAASGGTVGGNLAVGPVGGANPLQVSTNAGFNCMIRTNVASGRDWYFGGTATPTWDVYDNTAGQTRLSISSAGACSNTGGTWTAISEPDLKEDVRPWRRGRGLAAVRQLRPVRFRYRAGTPFASRGKASDRQIGLLADEVEAVLPDLVGRMTVEVDGEPREVRTINPGWLVYCLLNAVRELADEVDRLKGAG